MPAKVKVHICVAKRKKSGGAAEVALGSLGVNIIINDRVGLGTPHLLEHFSGFFFFFFFWLSASILPSLSFFDTTA